MLTTASSLPAVLPDAGGEEESTGASLTLAAAVREALRALEPPVSAEELCRRLCVASLDLFSCTSARTYLIDPESHRLACVARAHRRGRAVPRPAAVAPADLDAALAALGSSALLVGAAGRDAGAFAPLATSMGVAWLLAMPLRLDGRLLGFHVAGASTRSPLPSARAVASEIARIASLAIGSARLRAEITRLEHRRSEVLSMVSHELRSPLHVILGWESLLREGDLGALSPEQEEAVLRIGRNARQLADVIENTLGAGRVVAGQLPLDPTEVSLAELVGQVLQEAFALYGDPRVRMMRDVPADLPALFTDREKLRLVLRNLVGNAIKFTDRGEVRVTARTSLDRVEVAVADTGVGIAPEMLEAIFGEFQQAPAPDHRSRGGVGLGLYIVRSMLEKLGGTITVESTLGHGSSFRLSLPRRPPG